MFATMIRGYKFEMNERAITKFDAKILDRLITDNLSDSVNTRIPVYVRRLFANFTNNLQRVEMNMRMMNDYKEKKGFRYGPMRHLFIADYDTEKESLDVSLFARLFNRLMQTIVVYNNLGLKRPFDPSIELNSESVTSLLSGCQTISSNAILKKEFQSIIILNPKASIPQFIIDRQSDFESIGWKGHGQFPKVSQDMYL